METYQISKNNDTITISFSSDYFFSHCYDATIDYFDANDADPSADVTFEIVFHGNRPFLTSNDDYFFDESHIAQFFNINVLNSLIAADSRFDNDEFPY